ncbi:hypothetical protein DFH08DRAFT_813702 [Mycena albidolilacea]|uniref:Uncharacterized protein n=1 Tax=Mycena albidolilacea TaxID=1033008 RepID=A0AAD7EM27_9AGAR|nr:hypothetical protein DFH08DRAFT_813702 [Mycena albidolilacea]
MAKNHKLVMAQGIIKYAAEAHHCFSAAYHSSSYPNGGVRLYNWYHLFLNPLSAITNGLKEHDVNWQRQKEHMLRTLLANSTYTVKDEPAAFFLSLKVDLKQFCPRGEAHREKAAVIAQEVAVDEEQAKRKEALMDWTQEWVAKKHGTQHAPRAPLRVALCGGCRILILFVKITKIPHLLHKNILRRTGPAGYRFKW